MSWARVTERLLRSAEIPALELYGTWTNRPPLAEPQHGSFLLTRLPDRQWFLEQPIGTTRLVGDAERQAAVVDGDVRIHTDEAGWMREPAGMVAAPTSWFSKNEDIQVQELPGHERIAGRRCSRLLVNYSRHSTRKMMLWLDDEWPLVLAARSVDQQSRDDARFELTITELRPARDSHLLRCTRIAADTLRQGLSLTV
ncbi:hypothetical protein [Plantactinospora endophytica]|uniref:hypothetical protein n=1 Tax=Plantactinospora endophytica TaxID=673535 RepID=UPI00194392B6|nr:hypothetical protein [Plantactinospora endophytica]